VTVSRRDFLKQSGAALAVVPALQDRPASNLPQADGSIRELAMLALDAAKSAGATYADVRVSRAQSQSVATREDRVTNISDRDTMGFGTSPVPQSAGEWYLFFEPIFNFGLCFIEAAFRIRGSC
jgi:TldD protein